MVDDIQEKVVTRAGLPMLPKTALLLVLLLGAVVLGTGLGSVNIPPGEVLAALWRGVTGQELASNDVIVWQVRLPRVVMAVLVGAALSVCGGAFQGVFRNPLSDPYLLGVASGSALGATLAITAGWPHAVIPFVAMLAAVAAVMITLTLAREGRRFPPTRLILAGVVVGSVCSAATTALILRGEDRARQVLSYTLGNLSFSSWRDVLTVLPYVGLGCGVLLLLARALDTLQLGDLTARSLGVPVDRLRLIVVVAASLATAGAVAYVGIIGFVGLIVPHIVRLAFGELLLMGVAIGTAVALSVTPPPAIDRLAPDSSVVYRLTGYPDPGPPAADAWVSTWHTDWLWVALAALACGVYLHWARRLHARGDRWPVGRTMSWVLGWLIFVYTMCGAPGVYGRILFSWHMTMHMSIAMLVPLLLVPGAPVTLALRALPARKDKTLGPREVLLALVHSRYLQVFANPVVAAAVFFFSLAVFYFTPLFYYALTTHTGHVLMTLHFLMSGYLFAWVLVGIDPGPPRWHPLFLLVILFATVAFHAFLGVVITGSSSLLAPDFYTALDLSWAPNPVDDQHRGGAIAWGVGEGPTLVLALLVTLQWVRADRRETQRSDRRAERDNDAELEAYNAHLAGLAQRQGSRPGGAR